MKSNALLIVKKFISYLYLPLFLSFLLFQRSVAGLNIGSYRFGEFIVLLGLISSIQILFTSNLQIVNKYAMTPTGVIAYKLILSSFFISIIFNNYSTFDLNSYNFKASSYIWMTGFFFLTINLISLKLINFRKYWLILFAPLVMYIFSSTYYPDYIINFFLNNSDKFQFPKASDIFIVTMFSCILSFRILKKDRLANYYFITTVAAILPLLLYMSRGSFMGLVVYFFLEILYRRETIFKNFKETIFSGFLIIFIFLFSTLNIFGNFSFDKTTNNENIVIEQNIISSFTDSIEQIADNKNTIRVIFSFYIANERIRSTDGTTEWRLDIWQDMVQDLNIKELNIRGYGYSEIIPIMNDPNEPGRMGRDGLNEHVHNHFFNILGRGGYLQLLLFLTFYSNIIYSWYRNRGSYWIITVMLPVFIVSFFDISMEGVQFPFIFFTLLGFLISEEI